jgi:hypothetical protein
MGKDLLSREECLPGIVGGEKGFHRLREENAVLVTQVVEMHSAGMLV